MAKNDYNEQVRKALDKQFGKGSCRALSDDAIRMEQKAIPTGIDALDYYLIGCGGMPCGNKGIVEMYSEEGGGKSSLVYQLIGKAQRKGFLTFLSDDENSLDAERASAFGTNIDLLNMLEAPHLEGLLAMFEATMSALPQGVAALLAWDSLAATPTRAEVEEGLEKVKAFDTRAKCISQALRILNNYVTANGSCFLVVNQPRQKIGVMFGDPTTTPGGQALKSTASLRLALYPGKFVEKDGEKVARFITISAKKNRFAPPRKIKVLLNLVDAKFDNVWSTLNLAKELKLIGPRERGLSGLTSAHAELHKRFPAFPAEVSDEALEESETSSMDDDE